MTDRVHRAEQALATQGLHLRQQTAGLVEALRLRARKQQHRKDACPKQLEWLAALDRLDRAAAALSAERALVLWLIAQGEPWATPARRYLTAQTLEMDNRHRMLSRFELGLYELPEWTVASISAHWLELNRQFYGDRIQFDPGFATAWSELHHLFTAPWYLLAYPLAMQRFVVAS